MTNPHYPMSAEFRRKRDTIRGNCPFFDLTKGVVILRADEGLDTGDEIGVYRHDGTLARVRLGRLMGYYKQMDTASYEPLDPETGGPARLLSE